MPEQAAQQGHAAMQGSSRSSAGPRIPENRASSRSKVIGVSVAGVLLTAAAIAGVVMMTGSASAPVTTQVAAVSAPYAVAQTPAVAPAPVAPAQVIAPATNVAPALPPPLAAPAPAPAPAISDIAQFFAGLARPAPAPALNAPGQCEVGQMQQLAITLFASRRADIGNVIRIHAGSYVSPPIVLTRSSQTVTFPVPPGSRGWTRIIVEQSKANGGSTYEDDEANGITIEHEGRINPYQDVDLIRWTTPRC
jgi:hypothetical protein